MTIQVVDGAAGADELVEVVRRAEQRSLDAVGVSYHFCSSRWRSPTRSWIGSVRRSPQR